MFGSHRADSFLRRRSIAGAIAGASDLRQAEIENFGVPTPGFRV